MSTSKYSVANLGYSEERDTRFDAARIHFKKEGANVSEHISTIRTTTRFSQNTNKPENVSKFSAINIGLNGDDRHKPMRSHYKNEAAEVCQQLANVHHSRRLPYVNKQYPETTGRLSELLSGNQPAIVDNKSEGIRKDNVSTHRQEEHIRVLNDGIKAESAFNENKMRYFRNVGRQAVVYQEMTGRTPLPREFLYPQKASHQQILSLTGSIIMPDPFKTAPSVPRPKRWLGNDVGWES